MSGHSKWHSIRHKKGAADAKRGQLFTRIIKEIAIAARMGGGDEAANPRLRQAVLKAKEANMPRDNIERGIKKGTGELEGVEYLEMTYEAYGPGGVAILIEVTTDNKNRTAAEIRNMVGNAGGNLGESGSVGYLFQRRGLITYDKQRYSEDQVMEVALEAGAFDVSEQDEAIEVLTEMEDFYKVLGQMEEAGLEHDISELAYLPDATVPLDEKKAAAAMRLIETLEDHDDVQSVSTNLELTETVEAN